MSRQYFADEEPNIEVLIERDPSIPRQWEAEWTSGLCERCGGRHSADECRNVALWMLADIERPARRHHRRMT